MYSLFFFKFLYLQGLVLFIYLFLCVLLFLLAFYMKDPKKTLRSWFEYHSYYLEYEIEEDGPSHAKTYTAKVRLPLEGTFGTFGSPSLFPFPFCFCFCFLFFYFLFLSLSLPLSLSLSLSLTLSLSLSLSLFLSFFLSVWCICNYV